jgi:hypothetical protein
MSDITRNPTVGEFFRAIWQDWAALMSGAFSVPFSALAVFSDSSLSKLIWGATALSALIIMLFLIWAKERKRIVLLETRLHPNFAISFNQEKGGIVPAKERTELHSMGAYGGIRTVAGPEYNASYIRICVTATSEMSVKQCQAFIIALEKQNRPGEAFIHINLPEPARLETEPFEVFPNIPRMVDFLKASEHDNKLIRTGYWSHLLANVFDDEATYRFTIAVNGDRITSKPIKIDLVWRGAWDRISATEVAS